MTIYFKQRLVYKIRFLILNGAPHPILSIIRLMDKIPRVFFILGTLTRIHIATVNLLIASCSEIPFNDIYLSHQSYPSGRLNILLTVYPRKQEIVLVSRS